MADNEILYAVLSAAIAQHERPGSVDFARQYTLPEVDGRPGLPLFAVQRRVEDQPLTDLYGLALEGNQGLLVLVISSDEPFVARPGHWPSQVLQVVVEDAERIPAHPPGIVEFSGFPAPTRVLCLNDPALRPRVTDAGTLRFMRFVVVAADETRGALELSKALLAGDGRLESARPSWAPEEGRLLGPGHGALNATLDAISGREPLILRGPVTRMLDPELPVDWIRAVFVDDEDGGHWLFTTYGLSDLDEKSNDDPKLSGLGYELTLRVPGIPEALPQGPAVLLRSIAAIARAHGAGPDDLAPVSLNDETRAESMVGFGGLLVTDDARLEPSRSAFGEVRFKQYVGLGAKDYASAIAWDGEAFLDVLRKNGAPLLVSRDDGNHLDDPKIRAAVEARIARTGSTYDLLTVERLDFRVSGLLSKSVAMHTTPVAVDALARSMNARLALGRPFTLQGPTHAARFEPAEQSSFRIDSKTLVVSLAKEAQVELSYADSARPPGRLARFGRLTILFAG